MSKPLSDRINALETLVNVTQGRIDPADHRAASALLATAGKRLSFVGDHTVVALAGATGSGKSSLFNALSQTTLAIPGVIRPTTSKPMACVWGETLPDELLDWLDVSTRHLIAGGHHHLDGLVLMDLPDHDSTEVSHRLTVDRLVTMVDMLVWVVDPQKYADAALHERFLRPLAPHAGVMMVVLNQADTLQPNELETCVKDLRRILDDEGLARTPLLVASTLTGWGIARVRDLLRDRVAESTMMRKRISADLQKVVLAIEPQLPQREVKEVRAAQIDKVTQSCADAAGISTVTRAVREATQHRGHLATGWPLVRWLGRFRPDPLRRFHLDLPSSGKKEPDDSSVTIIDRTSLPRATAVAEAQIQSGVRDLARSCSDGLPKRWAEAVREASVTNLDQIPDHMDRAIGHTDLQMKPPAVWSLINVIQWLLTFVFFVGASWVLVNWVLDWFHLPTLPVLYENKGVDLPVMLLLASGVLSIIVAALSSSLTRLSARRRERLVRERLLGSMREVIVDDVVVPINQVISDANAARAAAKVAR